MPSYRRLRSKVLNYATAIGLVGVATLARLGLDPALGDNYPFLTYLLAVGAVAWAGRTGPSVAALLIGAAAADFFFVQPRYAFGVSDSSGLIGVGLFILIGGALVAMSAAMRAARTRAEALLVDAREQRALLQATLAGVGDGLIATDALGRVTFLNPLAERLTGWPQAEASGRTLDDVFRVVDAETRKPVDDPARRALRGGGIVEMSGSPLLVARDGTERPVDDSAAPVRDTSGAAVGAVIVFRDVTARVREEAAAAERTRLAAFGRDVALALAGSGDIPVILKGCAEAMVAHLGAAFARVWTLDQAGTVLELQASAGLYTHLDGPHGRVPVGQFKIGRIAANRQPHLTNDVPNDPEIGDREWAAREGMVAFAGYPLVVSGRLVGVVALFSRRPLTDAVLDALASVASEVAVGVELKTADAHRVQLSREVEAERTRLADVFQHAPAFMAVLRGPDHVIERSNDRFAALVNGRLLAGLTVFAGVPEVAGQGLVERLDQVYRTGRAVVQKDVRVSLDPGDGGPPDERVLDLACQPMRDAAGVVTGVLMQGVDQTARTRAEDGLRAAKDAADSANEAKSLFLANMSHELRTPLNAVILYSELLQEEAEDKGVAEFIPDLEKIRVAGRHLLGLINSVLDLSKIEAGKMDLDPGTFAVADAVREVVVTAKPLTDKGRNAVDVKVSADAGTAHADLTKVRQVLFNLVSNAAKFTEAGTITVSADRDARGGGDVVIFRVADTGIGMTPEQVAKLFQPFSQADESTTRKYGGTGLGLSISRRFAELMGGSLTVTSAEGAGTTFSFELPVATPVAVLPLGEAPVDGAALVIDDDPAARALVIGALADEGVPAVAAGDGEEGLRLARAFVPSVVFLDVIMPKADGWAVLAALKADPKVAAVPVVMLTMAPGQDLGYVLGAAEYLTKPVDRAQLLAVIRKYAPAGPGGGVLVVDDDPATRDVVRRVLVREGWSVTEAENGRAALEKLGTARFGLVVLDLMMPEMDGFAFLDAVRSQPAWRSLPVVLLTSKDLAPPERARLAGQVEAVIQKGALGREELLRQVRQLARRHATAGPTPQPLEGEN